MEGIPEDIKVELNGGEQSTAYFLLYGERENIQRLIEEVTRNGGEITNSNMRAEEGHMHIAVSMPRGNKLEEVLQHASKKTMEQNLKEVRREKRVLMKAILNFFS